MTAKKTKWSSYKIAKAQVSIFDWSGSLFLYYHLNCVQKLVLGKGMNLNTCWFGITMKCALDYSSSPSSSIRLSFPLLTIMLPDLLPLKVMQ